MILYQSCSCLEPLLQQLVQEQVQESVVLLAQVRARRVSLVRVLVDVLELPSPVLVKLVLHGGKELD